MDWKDHAKAALRLLDVEGERLLAEREVIKRDAIALFIEVERRLQLAAQGMVRAALLRVREELLKSVIIVEWLHEKTSAGPKGEA